MTDDEILARPAEIEGLARRERSSNDRGALLVKYVHTQSGSSVYVNRTKPYEDWGAGMPLSLIIDNARMKE